MAPKLAALGEQARGRRTRHGERLALPVPRRRRVRPRTPEGCYLAPLAEALSLEPAVTLAALEAGTWMVSPVCGLRAVRALR